MILILSDTTDESTCKVMDWIKFIKPSEEVIRISPADKITAILINNDAIIITFLRWNNEVVEIDFSKITAYWYRRGKLDLNSAFLKPFLLEQLQEYERNELERINAYIHHALKKIKSLNSRSNVAPNKLIVNDIAESCGLMIPQYLISSEKQRLLSYSANGNEVITKGIDESIYLECEDGDIKGYTEKFIARLVEEYNEDIFPSLLQKQVDKKYELRTFYLDGEFYSMAIFSQRDEQTQIDFRKYNIETPNRCVPFRLPKEIERKLKNLMDKLDLNSGSIDLIVDKNDDYIFLEVNPVGQFAMVSEPCNYFLEKKVAEFLIN
jgi:ATP-GRASP peptide maturase of grasp-with-spasm system